MLRHSLRLASDRAKKVLLSLAFTAISLLSLHAAEVADKIPAAARPFDLKEVKLLDGPFKHAEELNEKYLLSLDPDRLLHCFYATAGIPTQAKPYGGWEEPTCEVRGQDVGHYLSGCALAYRSSGNEKLKEQAAKVVQGMAECQAKMKTGYISAYPEEHIDRVIACKPVWAAWYPIHKIFAGLLDQYQLCGNKQALEVLEKGADWAASRIDPLTEEQMQKMLENEHGGMNEVLANLYGATGKEKYLKLSMKFNHHEMIDPAIEGNDQLDGYHANTQFPKFIGIARQYELTGDESLRKGAEFFWNMVTKERSYVTGGNSDDEAFSPKAHLSHYLGDKTTETCNVYNMLKLTRKIFQWNPRAEYGDFYERALFNAMLPQQNPETGTVLYYLPLKSGSLRTPCFGTFEDSFWCCTGTAMESHSKYGDSIYFHSDDTLYVNLFIASEVDWKEKGIKIRQETKFPEDETTKFIVTAEKPTEFALAIRHPYWARQGITLKLNGEEQKIEDNRDGFWMLARTWKTGDVVELSMPFSLRLEGFKDDPNKVAVMNGPIVLCALTTQGNPVSIIRGDKEKILAQFQPVAGEPNTFTAPAAVFRTSFEKPEGTVTFVPFYKEYKRPYAVYWEIYDDAKWAEKENQFKAEKEKQRQFEARRIDGLDVFDQAERDHHFLGENTSTGEHLGRHWRHAVDGGFFQYEFKVQPEGEQVLFCRYWGSDVGRKFDILVDGKKLATQELKNDRPGEFFTVEYPLPVEMLKGKEKITVRFQASAHGIAGGVFGCSILKGK